MRTTLALDDELLAKARAYTGLKQTSTLVRKALTALIERESARRLARLGGSEPGLKRPRRRRIVSLRKANRRTTDAYHQTEQG